MKEKRELTGAEIIWESLIEEGVDIVFGYPGGAILPAYDAFLRFHNRSFSCQFLLVSFLG